MVPIVSFVCWNRAGLTARNLNELLKNRQIIIFTCTNREKEILEKYNIFYNYLEL